MAISIPSISIIYSGSDADSHSVELAALAKSLQGAATILGAAANLALTGNTGKRASGYAVKVLASAPKSGSMEIVIDFQEIAAVSVALGPFLPVVKEALSEAVKKAVEAVTNYIIAKVAKDDSVADNAMSIAVKALEEMGHTSRAAINSMERVALANKPAVRALVAPVGVSCDTLRIGDESGGAFSVDKVVRQSIDATETPIIGNESTFKLLISELDIKNQTCKFRIFGEDDSESRLTAEITDPQIKLPHNPYSAAMDSQNWLVVKGKPLFRNGELERLYISDVCDGNAT